MADVIIKAGREKPIRNQHPWVFSGAIDSVRGNPEPGDIVTIRTKDNAFLGRAYWNAKSQIQARILTWQDESINPEWWRTMLLRAVDARAHRPQKGPRAVYRLVNAENDWLPGLIVDRYGDWLVLQALTLGIDQRKQEIAQILAELVQPKGIYERSDVDVRKLEGLRLESNHLWGEKPPERIEIQETARLWVDVRHGHKTGHYLDQAYNRSLLYSLVERIKPVRMLNVFSYTGGFGGPRGGGRNSISSLSIPSRTAVALSCIASSNGKRGTKPLRWFPLMKRRKSSNMRSECRIFFQRRWQCPVIEVSQMPW